MDDAIRMLVGGNRESDEILEWLEKCSNELLEGQLVENAERTGREHPAIYEDQRAGESPFQQHLLQPQPAFILSQTDAELEALESIRDLITFDHHYHRKDIQKEVMLSDSSSFFLESPPSVEHNSSASSCDSAVDLFPELM